MKFVISGQQQHQQYIRSSLRGMNPAQMGGSQMAGMAGMQQMGPGINPNNMMANQPQMAQGQMAQGQMTQGQMGQGQMAQSQMGQGQIAQNQQPGIGGMMGQAGGAMMQQTGRITPAGMGQGGGMIGQSAGNMIPQANRTMAPSAMMSQQGTGMVPQGMNNAGVSGIQQGVQGGQQTMFPGTQQFGGMGQNFGGGGGYGNQGMPQQPNIQQNMQMGNFNQRSQAEFLAQQRSLQQQQQQQVNQQQIQANRGFAQQVTKIDLRFS